MFKEVDVLLGDGGESDPERQRPERQRPGTMRELPSPYLKLVRCLFFAYFLFSERIVKMLTSQYLACEKLISRI